MIRKSALWLNRILWTALLVALLLVASYVSLGRYYIDYVDNYQQQLVERFVDMTGLPIAVESLAAYWSELSPVLEMQALSLYASDELETPVLQVQEVDFEINPITSFLSGTPQIRRLEITGLQFSLEEHQKGRWRLKGYEFESDGTTDFDNLIDLLLAASRLHAEQVSVELHFLNGKTTKVTGQELSLNRAGDFRRVRLTAGLAQTDKLIEVLIEANGDPRDKAGFEANGYAKIDDVDFKQQLPLLHGLGVEINDAQLDAELWLNIRAGGQWFVEGKVATPLVDLAKITGEGIEPLKNLQFIFLAEKDSQDILRLWFPELEMRWREQTVQLQNLQIRRADKNYQLSLPKLNLAEFNQQLQAAAILDDKGESVLSTLDPTGKLVNLHIDVITGGDTPVINLQAELKNVAVQPWRGAPGLEGVSGYIETSQNQGRVVLNTDHFVMAFPQIYDQPMRFTSAKAAVAWAISEDEVQVNSGPIYLQADHGPATGLLRLNLPRGVDKDPLMTLLVGLQNTEAAHRDKFIPKILSKNLLDWLQESIGDGFINQAGFIYRGSLKKDDALDRTVQLFVDTQNTDLNYHPDWPSLKQVTGLVVVDDDELWVEADSAALLGLRTNDAQVYFQAVEDDVDWLQVAATTQGPAADALEVLRSPAMKKILGNTFDFWELKGQVNSAIELNIPLDDDKAVPFVDVQSQLNNGALRISDFRLRFDEMQGDIAYHSEKGLSSTGINSRFFGKPLSAKINQDGRAIKIALDGRIDMADVRDWTGQVALNFLSGEAAFQADLFISGVASHLTLRSDLKGVSTDLPQPFVKTTDQSWPLELTMPVGQETSHLVMDIAQHIGIDLSFAGREYSGGVIRLGEKRSSTFAVEKDVLTVTGQLDVFDLAEWQPVFERYQGYADNKSEQTSVKVKDLSIGQLTAFDRPFEQATVDVERTNEAWLIALDNQQMDVQVTLSDNEAQALTLNFSRLQLPKTADEDTDKSALENLDPTDLIDATIRIEELFLEDQLLGNIAFTMNSEPSGLLVENIEGSVRGIQLGTVDSPLVMLWLKDGDRHQSFFNGGLLFTDFGDVMDRWGYERAIESKNGLFDLSLAWPGRPDEWLLAKSEGDVRMDFDDGRFLSTSGSTTGALKVVGILNFTNLMRRLKLDFSDVTDKGISFDGVDGSFRLGQGQLTVEDSLVIKSPSSQFQLRGYADLEEEQLDMELVATLPVAGNLPWVAAIAGGLPTAAGVYVASKIFKKSVDKFSSAVYSVKGDWNEPEMKFERMFSNKSKLPKNQRPEQQPETAPVEAR